jgi:hypothetical protein
MEGDGCQTAETTGKDRNCEQALSFTRHPAHEPRVDARIQVGKPDRIAGECRESAAQWFHFSSVKGIALTAQRYTDAMRNLSLAVLIMATLLVLFPQSGSAQTAPTATAQAEISADLGTCSALIAVTGVDLKPIYGAKITTRIRYGLMGVKKLDLEAFTGTNGQIKITNLPEVLKKPMYIYINKDDKQEIVEFKPDVHCHATFNVQLR